MTDQDYFSMMAKRLDLIPLRCPTKPALLTGSEIIRGDGWEWDPDQPVGRGDRRWTGEWKWSSPTQPQMREIEVVSDQSLSIFGVASLNLAGQYAIELGARPMVWVPVGADNDEAWEPEFFRQLDVGSPVMMLSGEIDVCCFNQGHASWVSAVDWGVSSPLVLRGIVLRVRIIDPSADLELCLFGAPNRRKLRTPLDHGCYRIGDEG